MSDSATQDVVLTVTSTAGVSTTVERLYEVIKNILQGGKLNTTNVILILVDLMKVVNTYPDLKGHQKKTVVLSAINMLIDDQNDNVEDAQALKILVSITLPTVIDVVVSVDTKKIKLGLKRSCTILTSCCSKSTSQVIEPVDAAINESSDMN